MSRLRFHWEAEEELFEARGWYAARSEVAAQAFALETDHAISRIPDGVPAIGGTAAENAEFLASPSRGGAAMDEQRPDFDQTWAVPQDDLDATWPVARSRSAAAELPLSNTAAEPAHDAAAPGR